MSIQLVVVRAFGAYEKGQIISDPGQVSAVLSGEHITCVVRIAAPPAAPATPNPPAARGAAAVER